MLNRVRTVEARLQAMSNQVKSTTKSYQITFEFVFQQAHMFDYLECLMDGLKAIGGDRVRVPERRRFDPEESCKFEMFDSKTRTQF